VNFLFTLILACFQQPISGFQLSVQLQLCHANQLSEEYAIPRTASCMT